MHPCQKRRADPHVVDHDIALRTQIQSCQLTVFLGLLDQLPTSSFTIPSGALQSCSQCFFSPGWRLVPCTRSWSNTGLDVIAWRNRTIAVSRACSVLVADWHLIIEL